MKPWEMASFAESKMESIARNEPRQMLAYCKDHLARIYPAGTRFASSNYSPYYAWGMGSQLVALNYQTLSEPMFMNYALFFVRILILILIRILPHPSSSVSVILILIPSDPRTLRLRSPPRVPTHPQRRGSEPLRGDDGPRPLCSPAPEEACRGL